MSFKPFDEISAREERAKHVLLDMHGLDSFTNRARADGVVASQHVDRYPLELLQNARDALARGPAGEGRVAFVVTDTALIVANDGANL
jgi:hypothetical protein